MTNLSKAFSAVYESLAGFMDPFTLNLPGYEWESCEAFTGGALCEWKKADAPIGRAVIFRSDSGAQMPLHTHPSEEIVTLISGELEMQIGSRKVVLRPGESVLSEINEPHAAAYLKGGLAYCWWPQQVGDKLEIGLPKKKLL